MHTVVSRTNGESVRGAVVSAVVVRKRLRDVHLQR